MGLTANQKRVMVTGGVGFLGSHLCKRLLNRGSDVMCVDNLYSGTKDNIAHLFTNPNFEFVRHDVTFPYHAEIDEIFNLACPTSPIHYQRDPVQTTKTSVHGAINMLGLAKRTGARIFQASTFVSLKALTVLHSTRGGPERSRAIILRIPPRNSESRERFIRRKECCLK